MRATRAIGTFVLVLLIRAVQHGVLSETAVERFWLLGDARSQCPGLQQPVQRILLRREDFGIELIHHGVRTATGGAVRLQPTPEQWDKIPVMKDRTLDTKNNSIELKLRYEDYAFDSRVTVTAKDDGVMIRVSLDMPSPRKARRSCRLQS